MREGHTLLHYRLVEKIGAGGMGVVWKAVDTRLDRTVAIKVLPSHLSDDARLRERFEREARTISSLNHPHICTLHDIGRHEGTDFIVMEHLEGETLAERLSRGALPLDQALRHGIEIARALHEAHQAGVVHRDLKPGNVMLTKQGVKLLDFGLAKLVDKPPLGSSPDAMTETVGAGPITDRGSILGTVQYMAPEQLEGKEADARADIFALGGVLYEMVTGRRAFAGESQASLISSIMTAAPPPVSDLQPTSPPLLDHLIRKCLAKDPDQRWHSACDLAGAMEWLAGAEAQVSAPATAAKNKRGPLWAVAGLIVGGLAVGYWMLGQAPQPDPAETTRFVVDLPADHDLSIERWPMGFAASSPIALSPDGRTLVYTASIGDGPSMLYARKLDQLGVTPIAGTEGGRDPFFSPDGEWVGFRTANALMKIPLDGGAARKIAETTGKGYVTAWADDDTLLFETGGSVLTRVPASGGDQVQVTNHEGVPHLGPQILPDGRGIMFTGFFSKRGQKLDRGWELAIVTAEREEARVLDLPGSVHWGRYLPTGHLLFRMEAAVMAAPFDLQRLQLTGDPVTVLDDASTSLTFSSTGTVAYVSGNRPPATLVWVDRDGGETPLQSGDFAYHFPRVSPDGKRVAFDAVDTGEVWIHDPARGTRMRFTRFEDATLHTTWTKDGKRLAFHGPSGNVYWAPSDGSGEPELLLDREHTQWPLDWSPDNRHLVLTEVHPDTGRDIWVLPVGGEPIEFLATSASEGAAKFSPDGRWIAYRSNQSGQDEIYVRPFPGPGGKWLVSTNGGREPVWCSDGTELFYRQGDAMMVVGVTLGESFEATRPRVLFRGDYNSDPIGHPMYDVHPDGERFLMVRALEGSSPNRITVVLNWFDELERLVPLR